MANLRHLFEIAIPEVGEWNKFAMSMTAPSNGITSYYFVSAVYLGGIKTHRRLGTVDCFFDCDLKLKPYIWKQFIPCIGGSLL